MSETRKSSSPADPGRTPRLRVLLVEDNPADAELAVHELRNAGVDVAADVAQTRDEVAERLGSGSYDIVLADYDLPGWAGMDALAELRRQGVDIPFVVVTGALGEERAVECIKQGATDYVLKDQLARLPFAVRRALDDVAVRAERKRVDLDLVRLRKAVESSGEAIFMTDRDGIFTFVNPEFTRLYGYTGEEVIGKVTPRILKSGKKTAQVYRRFWEAILAGRVVATEFVNRAKDGRLLNVESSANPILDESGNPVGFLAIQRDITERKRAEDALRASEANYRALVENATYGIFRSRVDGTFLAVNPALAEMLGYDSEDELLAVDIARDIYADPGRRTAILEELRDAGRMDGVEVEWKRKDGQGVTVRLSGRAVRGNAGALEAAEFIAEDVTEQRALEAQLRQAQKMEAVGRLAGGVAHDFNNILTVILGAAELLLEQVDTADRTRADLEEIRASANRAAALTRQLLAFSRRQVLEPRALDLNAVVGNVEKMLRRLIGADIELRTVLRPGLGAAMADPGQLEQVIMNLALNARDAMPDGGKLTIETADAELDPAYADEHPRVQAGRYVMLAVSDTGVGMDAATLGRLFEPFFTTKEHGRGTGLGLATVYGIVKQSGGYVWAYSEPGQGATFKVYLPRADAVPEALAAGAVPEASLHGSETILLAEDAEPLRSLIERILKRYGYAVLTAASGSQALELAERHDGPIALLLTDVVMPGMSGRDLAERIIAARPDIRILYTSGYTDAVIVWHGVLDPGVTFLQKPFTPKALARKVREVLDTN